MAEYDFKSLSSYDFEILIRDLLQKELKKRFQSFKTGRDKGIDLRYSSNGNRRNIIVQCKHYADSKISDLKNHLKVIELDKIKKLKPKRYILATSIGLTPPNKQDLYDILHPYCKSEEDILGREDINNLIGKYPEVEKKNFKLWLTSVSVLERVLHNDVFNRTESDKERIQKRLKYYVQNQSFQDAIKKLDQKHVCIISGNPGIGKTTLAEILLIYYLKREYEIYS